LVRVGYVKPLRLLVRKRVGYVRLLRMGPMGVRVKVRIKHGDASLDLVNTGYETDVPEILAPVNVAERLGLLPRL
jgi:hypothetical protein